MDRRVGRKNSLLAAKPFLIKRFVRAIFFKREQGRIHAFEVGTAPGKDNAVVLLAKDWPNHVDSTPTFMGSVIEKDRRIVDDGIDFLIRQSFVSFFDLI